MRTITFMEYSGFMKQYCSKEVTSVRLSTINVAGITFYSDSDTYADLVNRICECMPDLKIQTEFIMKVWVYIDNLVMPISKQFTSPDQPIEAKDVSDMLLHVSCGMPVAAFEVTLLNARPIYRRCLFIVV